MLDAEVVATATTGRADATQIEVAGGSVRATLGVICGMLWYQGFTMSINGVAAPWVARDFGLSESGIAQLYAWISISALGALVLSRLADRVGRRRVLLWCMAATPVCALGAALSVSQVWFVIFEIGIYACVGATLAAGVVMLAEELPIEWRARGQSFGGLAIALGGGLCLMLMPLADQFGWSWRWLLALSVAWVVMVPFLRGRVPESSAGVVPRKTG